MIDTGKELNTIKRGHTAVQLRGHSSCVVTDPIKTTEILFEFTRILGDVKT